MNALRSLIGGAAGAAVLTLVHQAAKQTIPHAPRVDVIGRRVVAGPIRAMGLEPPKGQSLQSAALGLDLVSNAGFYALLGLSDRQHRWPNALALGLVAGVGALLLPPVLGMSRKPVARRKATAAMTVAWYTLGALATAGALEALDTEDGPCCR